MFDNDDITQSLSDVNARFMASLSPREYTILHSQDILKLTLNERAEYSALFRAWVKALIGEAAKS